MENGVVSAHNDRGGIACSYEPLPGRPMAVRLETQRLVLRDLIETDAERLYDLDHDPQVMRYIGPFGLDSVEASRQRIVTVYAAYAVRNDGLGLWGAVEKSTGSLLGWICLRPANDDRFAKEANFPEDAAELGYRLFPSAWGRGFATEASKALIRDVFSRQAVPIVVATALEANGASIRVMEKCGLRWTRSFQLPGINDRSVRYELTRAEFRSDRERTR